MNFGELGGGRDAGLNTRGPFSDLLSGQPGLLVQRRVPLPLDLGEVARELEADADVVLHAPDLPAQGHRVLLKSRERRLVLVRVNLHLLPQAHGHTPGVPGYQGLPDVDPALLQHQHDQLAHGVLHRVCGQDPDSIVGLVDVELGVAQVAEGPLVVLCGGSGQSYI